MLLFTETINIFICSSFFFFLFSLKIAEFFGENARVARLYVSSRDSFCCDCAETVGLEPVKKSHGHLLMRFFGSPVNTPPFFIVLSWNTKRCTRLNSIDPLYTKTTRKIIELSRKIYVESFERTKQTLACFVCFCFCFFFDSKTESCVNFQALILYYDLVTGNYYFSWKNFCFFFFWEFQLFLRNCKPKTKKKIFKFYQKDSPTIAFCFVQIHQVVF